MSVPDPSAWLRRALMHWKGTFVGRIHVRSAAGGPPPGPGMAGREDRPCALGMQAGRLRLRTPGSVETLLPGDVAILSAGTGFRLEIPVSAEILMLFADHGVSVQWLRLHHDRSVLLHQADSGTVPPDPVFAPLLATLARTGLSERARRSGWTFVVQLLQEQKLAPRRRSGGDPIACLARDRIQAGFADPALDVVALARDLGVHRSTVLRAFRRQGLGTPQAFLLRCRIDLAQDLLRSTILSTDEVARCAGFANRSVFHRAFRRMTGVPPQRYRRFGHHDGRRSPATAQAGAAAPRKLQPDEAQGG